MTNPNPNPKSKTRPKHKLNVDIDKDLYLKVTHKFFHGQLTALIRNIFQSLEQKISDGSISDVATYIDNAGDLTLPANKNKD